MPLARPLLALVAATFASSCALPAGSPHCPASDNWRAWVNAMPGPDAIPTLIVVGQVAVPEGHTARLRPGATDRMMPPGQRFELLVFNDPGKPGGWQEVRGTLAPALPNYREVIIGCGDETVTRISPIESAY